MQIDFTNAPGAKALFESSTSKLYYTSDTAIRESEQDNEALSRFAWQEAAIKNTDGDKITFTLPADAIAIKADTILSFGESAIVSMTAGLDNPGLASGGDVYANTAFVFRNDTRTNTETTMVTVMPSGLSGMLWEDMNADGIRQDSEQPIAGALVGLYAPHNPSGKGAAITVDGIEYDAVYDVNGNEVAPVTTGADGAYHFTSLRAGTYFVISQGLDQKYLITGKHKTTDTTIDSDAEETQPVVVNAETIQLASGKSVNAWIRDIAVGDSETKEHLDIGMIPVSGSVDITKNLDQIYFPSTMTDEEKQYYYPTFHYTLHCPDGTDKYTTVQMSQTKLTGYARFANLPAGTYTLEEEVSLNYKLGSIESDDIKTQDVSVRTVTFTVTAENQNFHVTFKNKMIGMPPAGDQNQVINHIPMHTPISLKVDYTGPALIQSATATSYTFKAEEIHGVVTYDDGSTQDVTIGTTGFSLSPETITNMMNTGNNAKTIHAYYSERGVLLEDTFAVNVNLKPAHKFKVVYHANDNILAGKATAAFADNKKSHTVYYLYDQLRDVFYSYNGTYEEPVANSTEYTFTRWSTSKSSVSGTEYQTEADLKDVALDSNITQLDLYACWATEVTFNAVGGNIYKNDEKGESVQTVLWDVGSALTDNGLTAKKENFTFVEWNDQKDGLGTSPLGQTVTEPRTVYAAYYQSHYPYTGNSQEFVAPKTGTYYFEAVGGASKSDGGTASGYLHLTKGTKLYVYVGDGGLKGPNRLGLGGVMRFNGGGGAWGGKVLGQYEDPSSGAGATDIRTIDTGTDWSNEEGLKSRIMVAGGAGGYGGWEGNVTISAGDSHGGGLTGGKNRAWYSSWPGTNIYSQGTTSGGTQTSGYAFGYGQTAPYGAGHYNCGNGGSGGGGGGWYGGTAWQKVGTGHATAGGGGSGYVSGFNGCETSATGYVFDQASLTNGRENWTGGGCAHSTDDHCLAGHADIRLTKID